MSETKRHDAAIHWDAGQAGCGALVSGLKRQLDRLAAGQLLSVTAVDAAAPIDIAAWCEMTGNLLVTESHPNYVLQRKKD